MYQPAGSSGESPILHNKRAQRTSEYHSAMMVLPRPTALISWACYDVVENFVQTLAWVDEYVRGKRAVNLRC